MKTSFHNFVVLLSLVSAAFSAFAGEEKMTIGFNLMTLHFGTPKGLDVQDGPSICNWIYDEKGQDHFICETRMKPGKYRSQNPGIYFVWTNNVLAGVYKNSYYRTSFMSGYVFKNVFGPIDLTVGGVTGYPKSKVMPLVVPSIKVSYFRISYLPPLDKNGGGLHLSTEFDF